MNHAIQNTVDVNTISIQGKSKPVWPERQHVEIFNTRPHMLVTEWQDTADYHPRLIEHLLEREQSGELVHRMEIGGSKIRNVHEWGIPEADLVYERVLALYRHVMGQDAMIDLSWANIYRKGDYLSPHSHDISQAAVVYMLDPGEPRTGQHPFSGSLVFTDPRLEACCPKQADCVNKEVGVEMKPGTMMMFPAPLVHFVHPYMGERPRITIAFNISPV
jgi:hypothetical protein